MIPILDAGHGGLINGVYQTDGKRSPYFPDGTQLYEGVFNRLIVDKVAELLQAEDIPYITLYDGDKDLSLSQRSTIANNIATKVDDDTMLISVHANAHGDGSKWTSAKGIETFHYGNDKSYSLQGRKYAKQMQDILIKNTGRINRYIKPANFHMLRETSMPSILIECGFMTNYEECSLLKSPQYQDQIAKSIVEFIKNLN